ncbi:MAG TPA: hypothetical protein VEP90_16250, partial [Methylomirabilota bacterium]|nr:hypothetical protein [Methylomirabilota bacterium]
PRKPTHLKVKLNMATATLTWTLPTTRTDGSVLNTSDIASVSVFDVSTEDPSHHMIGTAIGPATTFTTDTLTVGFHNFTVGVVDTAGHVSADSNVASVEVKFTLADPSPAADLTAVLNA